MKYRNIFFVICASIMCVVETYSMLTVVKQISRSRTGQVCITKQSLHSAVDEEKSREIKEYCDKIKTITIMKYSGGINDENVQQYGKKRCVKADDSRRSDDSSARDLNMLMVNAYMAKQICDIIYSDTSSSSSYPSDVTNYSSSSYTGSSSSSGESGSSYGDNE